MSSVRFSGFSSVAALAAIVLTACAPAGGSSTREQAPAAAPKTLNVASRTEPLYVSGRGLATLGISANMTMQSFSAGLSYVDERTVDHPHLAEVLPSLNTDSWKVSADGTMDTTWRLRPNLTWHDGTAFSADAFVFAFEVFSNPENGTAAQKPINFMSEVRAPDARTVVIKWKIPFPDAASMAPAQLPPLPRHILAAAAAKPGDTLAANPYWNREFVGLGPYRMIRWEPGAFMEAQAFDQYVLGRPKIDKLRWVFIGDFNVAVANFLSGAIDIGFDVLIRTEQADTLEQQWQPGEGTIYRELSQTRVSDIQMRPEYADPPTLLDLRVRKALIHAMDREALNEGVFQGRSAVEDSFAAPVDFFFEQVDKVVAKYPFDPRRAAQFMGEAGYARGADGVWAHPTFGRFAFQLWTLTSTQNEQEMHIMADGLRRQGFDVSENVHPMANLQNIMVRSMTPGLSNTSGHAIDAMTKGNTPGPENRWVGGNYPGWYNAEYDRLIDAYNTTLDQGRRYGALAQAAKIMTEDVSCIPTVYNPRVIAFRSTVTGPVAPNNAYNIHEWVMR